MTTTIAPVTTMINGKAGRQMPFAELFSEESLMLLDRLGLGRNDSQPTTLALGMTSCTPGEGVTTVVTETAVAAAKHLQLRTVLVDCHFARPTVHRTFGVGLCPGLRDALDHDMPLSDVVRPSGIESLSIVTAGTVQEDLDKAPLAPKMRHLISELRTEFDFLLFDLPTLNQGRPARVGAALDGVVLIVEAERVQWQVAQRATTSLRSDGVSLLGAVLNKRRRHLPSWFGRAMQS
jgi:succinoglycan biosynthesis transport protein ExoP